MNTSTMSYVFAFIDKETKEIKFLNEHYEMIEKVNILNDCVDVEEFL